MKEIKDSLKLQIDVLKYLAKFQGEWTCLWFGYFKDKEINDVYSAMPEGTSNRRALAIMKLLHYKKLIGGCSCGCRGDFEITNKGLTLINQSRKKPYTGY